jgi:hypothetical protein
MIPLPNELPRLQAITTDEIFTRELRWVQTNLGIVSGAWPAANRAIYLPFAVDETVIIDKLGVFNGSTASGNLDLGIYSATTLAKLVSSGSTAQSGTNTLQALTVTDTTLAPGCYFLACAMNGTTGTALRYAMTGSNIQYWECAGMRQEASAFALPATATPSNLGNDYVPFLALFKKGLPS